MCIIKVLAKGCDYDHLFRFRLRVKVETEAIWKSGWDLGKTSDNPRRNLSNMSRGKTFVRSIKLTFPSLF